MFDVNKQPKNKKHQTVKIYYYLPLCANKNLPLLFFQLSFLGRSHCSLPCMYENHIHPDLGLLLEQEWKETLIGISVNSDLFYQICQYYEYQRQRSQPFPRKQAHILSSCWLQMTKLEIVDYRCLYIYLVLH